MTEEMNQAERLEISICRLRGWLKATGAKGLFMMTTADVRECLESLERLKAVESVAAENEALKAVLCDFLIICNALKQGRSSGLDLPEVWKTAGALVSPQLMAKRLDELESMNG